MHRTSATLRAVVATAAAGAALLATVAFATPAGAAGTTTTSGLPIYQRNPVVVLTQADNGRTIRLHQNQTVAVVLSPRLSWTVRSTNPKVIRRAASPYSLRVAVFRTARAGTAELVGLGAPRCSRAEACPQYRRLWRVHLIVRYAAVPLRGTSGTPSVVGAVSR